MKTQFSKNLVEYRKNMGLTQEQAAGLIGIKRATLGAYEEGRAEPAFEILAKICRSYQVTSVNEFLFGDGLQTKPGTMIEERYRLLRGKERVLADVLLGLKHDD